MEFDKLKNSNPKTKGSFVRYLDIVENEGLEISQPALDPQLSEVHHQITIRNPKGKVHRYIFNANSVMICLCKFLVIYCILLVTGGFINLKEVDCALITALSRLAQGMCLVNDFQELKEK